MNFYTAKQIAEQWNLSVQQIRKYCKEGKIKSAFQYEGQWLIPENTKPPEMEDTDENQKPPLLKKILYQLERNNHYGIYEYIQINLAYSSSRMASNRLTRQQVQEMYRCKHITPSFESTKVDDIIEIDNHFMCVRYAMENALQPLTVDFVKQIHHLLTYGTYADKRQKVCVGAFRSSPTKLGIPAEKIQKELTALLRDYEKWSANYEFSSVTCEDQSELLIKILNLHARFEHIHPFDDYNGRAGRILMLKECLRHGIDPFIIDDKRRGAYNRGITQWDKNPDVLQNVVCEAQKRFQNQLETCNLMQYHRPPT